MSYLPNLGPKDRAMLIVVLWVAAFGGLLAIHGAMAG